jgi:hypothetical protein
MPPRRFQMKKKTSPEIEKKSPETQEIVDSGKEIVDSGKEIVDSDEDISTYDSRPKHVRRAEKRAENVANKPTELRRVGVCYLFYILYEFLYL